MTESWRDKLNRWIDDHEVRIVYTVICVSAVLTVVAVLALVFGW